MLSKSIAKLVQYGIESGITPECERNYTINLLMDGSTKMSIQNRMKQAVILTWKKLLKNFWTRL